MTVGSKQDAWEIADRLFPTDYEKDEASSRNAGYPIYVTTDQRRCVSNYAWISDLGTALELNIGTETIRINIREPKPKEALLTYLQSQMDDFKKYEARYGIGDHIVMKKMDAMIACKEMAEAIIQEPINLRQDGKVTVGF